MTAVTDAPRRPFYHERMKIKTATRLASSSVGYHDPAMMKKIEQFHEGLNRLHFEGKASLRKNLKDVGRSVEYFSEDLCGHMAQEEEYLFPFLEKHVPKLGPIISLLMAEHQDFRQSLGQLNVLLDKVGDKGVPLQADVENITRIGSYMTFLLRSHLWAENETLDKTMREELRPEERKMLLKQIRIHSTSACQGACHAA